MSGSKSAFNRFLFTDKIGFFTYFFSVMINDLIVLGQTETLMKKIYVVLIALALSKMAAQTLPSEMY